MHMDSKEFAYFGTKIETIIHMDSWNHEEHLS